MKEHFQDQGVRKWAGDDLIELQSESLTALQGLVEPYAPCIIKGCEVSVVSGSNYKVSAGLVALPGNDHTGSPCVKVARVDEIPSTVLPVYLTLAYTTDTRVYSDGQSKEISHNYTANVSTVQPEGGDYLTIGVDGGSRLVDTLGITAKLEREGGEAKDVKVTFAQASSRTLPASGSKLGILMGSIRKWLYDLKALAFKDKVAGSDLDADVVATFNKKVDKKAGYALSKNDFTDALLDKLNGIAANANNYALPLASSSTRGGIKIGYSESSNNRAVKLSSEKAYVNIPNASSSVTGLMSATDKAKLDKIAEGANKTVVDSALSTTSTNPVQNKVIKEELDGKQGKFSNGGTLQVSSINGNTALSAGNVDAKADYVEVQYTGSSDASFDFNNKFSANWFTDRTNKPQRMLLRNNSSGTLTVTTSGNANFSYNFIKVTIPASGYVEFLVYKSIVAVTANSNESNPLKGAIIETGHEAVCLSLSLKESGTIPSSDLAKLKEDKSRIPLFYHDGNNSNLLFPATYNWNGTKLYVQLIEPQPDNFRMTSITYSSSGVWESKKNIALDFSGDGTEFLNNKGVYAAVPGPHVVAHGMVSADGTVTFYYGEGRKMSHTTGIYRFMVTGGLIGRILLAFPMQDGFYLSQAALSGGTHTITTYKNGTKTDCDFCFIVYAMN